MAGTEIPEYVFTREDDTMKPEYLKSQLPKNSERCLYEFINANRYITKNMFLYIFRLSGHIHRQFTSQSVTSLEDLSLGDHRPTALVRQYDSLYSEGRVEALDALDDLQELQGLDVLKMKILPLQIFRQIFKGL